MKTLFKIVSLLILIFIVSLVYAQEPTAQVTQEAPVSGGVNVTVTTPPAVPTPSDTSPTGIVVLVLGVVGTFILGISLGLQYAGNRAAAVSNDPNAVSLLERGYDNLPDAIKAATKPIVDSLERSDEAVKALIELAHKLTDGIPEASKPVDAQAAPTMEVNRTFKPPYTSTSTSNLTPDAPQDDMS